MASRGKGISTRWKLGMVHFSSYDAAASLNNHLSCYLFFSAVVDNDYDGSRCTGNKIGNREIKGRERAS